MLFRSQLQCGLISGDYLIRTDKAVYDGGDTLTLDVLGGGVEPVFVDLIKDGQTILSQTVELADGGGQLRIDLPADQMEPLLERGVLPGCQLCPVRRSPSGDPIVMVEGTLLAIRQEVARCLCVRRAETSAA